MVLACRVSFEPGWVHLPNAWYHVTHVPHYILTLGCRHGTEPCYRCATVRLLLRLHHHLVSDAVIISWMGFVSLLTTATAYCNHTSTSAGGSGCTVLRHTRTSSKELLVKVSISSYGVLAFCTDVVYSAVGHSGITCSGVEYVSVSPPGSQSCQQYLGQYINQSGGYITNPNALDNCQYCSYSTTDEFLESNSNIFYSHHWRNFGFMWLYIGFNVRRHHHF
jgi:hypothetical protein